MILALLAGCATGGGMSAAGGVSTPAQAYFKEGRTQEQAGALVEATRMYKLAQTLSPRDSDIAAALQRVEAERRRLAEEHYQTGEQEYARGRLQASRIAYLKALRQWPEHAGALERLRSREKITVTHPGKHIVQKGETLAMIAKKYYGDYRKYRVIAEHNQITDVTQLKIGQEITIPEMAGTPLPVVENTMATDDSQQLAATAEESISQAVDLQVANYRDAGKDMLREGDYAAAIVEFRKVLNVIPDDQEAKQDLCVAHNAYGRQLWDLKQIDQAREQFDACIAFREDCPACRKTVKDCENYYKERLYNRGIAFFQDEKPQEALNEWQIVKKMDPGYRNVEDYIQKAKKISEQLGKLKQGQKSP
jgi:tetratricopeptide (TPR) repeat protein